ncbi:copper-containing nitrite reductase [Gilvimarinus sp. F26214L]|uniref:copper-containing nitrite reductase n=1 Tax=Gilvimarinus sp. DZF01 TaxID=3461371 RepID=UPI00404612EC
MKQLLAALTASLCFIVGMANAQQLSSDVEYRPDVTFTLRTDIADGKLVFISESGSTKGEVNPDLRVPEGAVVQINIVNQDGAVHDIAIPEFGVKSQQVIGRGAATAVVFRANKSGEFEYLCTLPGHKAAGMFGALIVGEPQSAQASDLPDVSMDPTNVGEPVGKRKPRNLTVDLETTEIEATLGDGSTYKYWTFNNTVPGPFVRAREGDTVTINMTNAKDSLHIHSIDLHAVTGPGGGAAVTQAAPGQTKSFTFKTLQPGLYVYHCATPMVAQHITNGMYGMILVEPEGGLAPVDREFYVMQGELYTAERHGSRGLHEFSLDKLLAETPEHMMFNGTMAALTTTYPMEAEVGETVRIFFGVGGPNLSSSFHVIGEIFDRVYDQASLTSPPLTDVQTTLVPPGGATMVEFKVEYPGRYTVVDHALTRVEKGLAGVLTVKGKADSKIFHSKEKVDANH